MKKEKTMDKLLKARNRMAKNSKKGFTLVELIVVIVILAILIAALVPAILGVINQANIAADQADVRAVMMAGSVVGMQISPPQAPDHEKNLVMNKPEGNVALNSPEAVSTAIVKEFTGGVNVVVGTYTIAFDGAVAVGGMLPQADSRSGQTIVVGLDEGAFSASGDSQAYTIVRVTVGSAS